MVEGALPFVEPEGKPGSAAYQWQEVAALCDSSPPRSGRKSKKERAEAKEFATEAKRERNASQLEMELAREPVHPLLQSAPLRADEIETTDGARAAEEIRRQALEAARKYNAEF
eukprot:TRINITY_DN77156_c0_g1_i1.p3 TRINITY_DN77156_c0_g1~~TRINITY_DN77156_c0_g1_i1.p3  ORF type:complete len:114 (-),score=29.08 TRINITY_DN77156_c0_g1_i1:188-529(-)